MPGTMKKLLEFFSSSEPIQPKGQIGNRNAEKQDRKLPGGRNKDIRVRKRKRRSS